jgi:hypothetical protein
MRTAAFIVALLIPAVALAPSFALAQGAPFPVGDSAVAIPPPELAPVATAPEAPAPVTAPAAPIDAIGALIEQSGGAEIDEDTAEHIASPEPVRAPQVIAPNAGYTPSYARPNPSGLDRPVMLHETGVSPDGPPDLSELTYESRVRGSIAAAQGLQGPLDGSWSLNAGAGGKLYAFQMVDPGAGFGSLEGAWRDLKRSEAIGAVGVIDDMTRNADGGLTVRFSPRAPGEVVVVTLSPGVGGTWSGQLTDGATTLPVTLVRDGPSPTVGYAVLGQTGAYGSVRPYDPAPRAAPVRKAAPKATKGKKGKAKATVKKKAPAKKPAAKKKK